MPPRLNISNPTNPDLTPPTAFAEVTTPSGNSSTTAFLNQASTMLRASLTASSTTRHASLRALAHRSAVSLADSTIVPDCGPPSNAFTELKSSAPSPDFVSKYQEKLLERAKANGYSSVNDMMTKYRERRAAEESDKRKQVIADELAEAQHLTSTDLLDTLPPHVKPLKDILHIDKVAEMSPEFIEKLWIGFHADKINVSAVIPRDMYILLHSRSKKFPMFVIPIFRGNDIEMFLLQHSGHQTFFTSLLSYKTHGPEAPVLFTLTYYTDFIDSKGIVLVHGEGDIKQCNLDVQKRLTQGMRNFYVDQEFALVEQMHTAPNEFSYDHVLAVVKARMDGKAQQTVHAT